MMEHPAIPPVPASILMTVEPAGGAWTRSVELARELCDAGSEVTLAVTGGSLSPDQRALAYRIPGLDMQENASSRPEECADWLLDLEDALSPRVVHLNGCLEGALPWRTRTVMSVHPGQLTRPPQANDPDSWARQRETLRRSLTAADLVVAPSHAVLSLLVESYGLSGGRIIPPGRDPSAFAPADKEPLILGVGRVWESAKNFSLLDDIAPLLNWPMVVAGDNRTPAGEAIRLDNVSLLGRLPQGQLAAWYARAAIFVYPSRFEPSGLSVLEAALSGCALVLADTPSLREIWTGAALFACPDDPAAFAARLRQLAEDRSLREAMGHAARSRALRYGSRRMAEAYCAAYGEALATSSMRSPAAAMQLPL
ncbi:glycosyltransferase family 4 protein [Telmatospirillum sp. J64-1]|uniref:glycosyltransferase family 4 protein n=1 Tax=Telmatospirillum sp. J64-1 TaxID=2502183 RepID=UPI00163D4CBA|nr:glycosyltransferase family 4 protein [Telmatospirillum sp. J64-1]